MFQEHLIPNSAWKDYSAASTNYAFDAYESEEKSSRGPKMAPMGPPSVPPPRPPQGPQGPQGPHGPRTTYSLPRTNPTAAPSQFNAGYYTHRPSHPNAELQPDFYFMPSQRKYSGEVVRVYVDYNNKKS